MITMFISMPNSVEVNHKARSPVQPIKAMPALSVLYITNLCKIIRLYEVSTHRSTCARPQQCGLCTQIVVYRANTGSDTTGDGGGGRRWEGGGGRDFVKPRWVYVILGRAISNPNHLRNKTRAERQVCSLKTSYCITYVISCYTVYSFNNICHVTPLLRKILPTLQCIRKVTQRMRLYIRNTTGRIGHKAVGNVIN